MKRITKALAVITLMTMVALATECNNANGNSGGNSVNKSESSSDNSPKGGANNVANGHEYVDLGLPSGTLWATCNVGIGVEKPEDYGDHYAWGETKRKDIYNWETYNYANGDLSMLTKYCIQSDYGYNGFVDNLTSLQASDDFATANWGSGWQTPSKEQWDELMNNTTNQWTTQNGVAGRLFTSMKNGQTLFLPAVGYSMDENLYYLGVESYYWSSSLCTKDSRCAWSIAFSSEYCGVDYYGRQYGRSVRAVRSVK